MPLLDGSSACDASFEQFFDRYRSDLRFRTRRTLEMIEVSYLPYADPDESTMVKLLPRNHPDARYSAPEEFSTSPNMAPIGERIGLKTPLEVVIDTCTFPGACFASYTFRNDGCTWRLAAVTQIPGA
jgi:hypothetical protein